MQIPKFSNISNNFLPKKTNTKNKTSFKGIYIEDIVALGKASQKSTPPKFLPSDALLLNRISQEYPNQDCFIRAGYAGHPRLEYREKPPEVQIFDSTLYKRYVVAIDPYDREYPSEPLIIYDDSCLNMYIGMPSFISTNPSLAFTVKTGYELHKKLIEKKYQIKEALGKNDELNIGEEALIKKAHKEIEKEEAAVTRYLMESSLAALTDKASAEQIYASNFPKIQTRLDAERKFDLTTSLAKRPKIDPNEFLNNKVDICEKAMQAYPHFEENKKRIEEIADYFGENGIVLNS